MNSNNMAREVSRIMRSSIYAFLTSYHSLTAATALLVFPASAAILLWQAAVTPSFLSTNIISSRLRSLFEAAHFPASSYFFSFLHTMLSQTIISYVFTLPFSLTFLVLAKVSIVRTIHEYPRHKLCPPPFSSLLQLYSSVLQTCLFNSFAILTANISVFSLFFLAFNLVDILGLCSGSSLLALSVAGAILYSIVVASSLVTCNLGIIVSAVENSGGYLPVLKACMLIRGRMGTALSLALAANLGMAGVEALFQYRVIKPYYLNSKFSSSLIWECFLIAYMHSFLIVLDVIMSYMFFKSCQLSDRSNLEIRYNYMIELEPEEKGVLQA